MGIKALSLSDLENQERGSIWVLNTAPQSRYEYSGNVLLAIPNLNGQGGSHLTIKQTWLPQDVSALFGRTRVLNSTDFRSAVIKGLITVVDETTASRMLAQEGAREEERRLMDIDNAVTGAARPRSISDSSLEIRGEDNKVMSDEVQVVGANGDVKASKVADLDENGLKPGFSMWAERLAIQSDIEALNAIRSRGKFTRREVKHLARTLQNHPKTQTQLQARIARYAEIDRAKGKI